MPSIPRDRPLVVSKLCSDGSDPGYTVYGQAYGIEMQFDPEWPVTMALLAPPEHLRQVTVNTDVQSLGIQAGVSLVMADLAPASPEVNWVMAEGAGLGAALAAGYRCVTTAGTNLSALTTEERARVAVVASADEVVRVRQSFPDVAVLLTDGTAEECRAADADGVFLEWHFERVLEVCKGFVRAQ